jgi:DNA-binding MarR family transcriptional regulator
VKRYSNPIDPAPPDVPWRALAAFRHRIRAFLSLSERAARGIGLEPQQHHLLLAVRAARETADPTIADLARELLLKHHSVVGLVDRLERRGYVARHRHPSDGRQVCVRTTPLGESLLDRLTHVLLEEYGTVGPELVQALEGILRRGAGELSKQNRGAGRVSKRPAARTGRRAPAPAKAARKPKPRARGGR